MVTIPYYELDDAHMDDIASYGEDWSGDFWLDTHTGEILGIDRQDQALFEAQHRQELATGMIRPIEF